MGDEQTGAATTSTEGLWQRVADRLDLATFIPNRSSGVETVKVDAGEGHREWVMRSPIGSYCRLTESDFELWCRMDGRRTVQQLAIEQFAERGDFVGERAGRLVGQLRVAGFLGTPPVDCFALVAAHLRKGDRIAWLATKVSSILVPTRLRLRDPDRLFTLLHSTLGWAIFSRSALVLWCLLVPIGLGVWWGQVVAAEYPLFQTRGSYLLGFVTLIVLDGVGVSLHNLTQGLMLKRAGRTVSAAGVTLAFIVPSLYVATSDAWLATRRQRIAVSLVGPFALLLLGAVLALLAYQQDGTELGALMFKGATIWFANALFNLLPILDLAGYFALVDYLHMPDLRSNSVHFLRNGLFSKLRAGQPFTRDERVFVGYGALALVTIVLAPIAILQARELRYTDSLLSLWSSGALGARALAVGLAMLFLGPPSAAVGRLVVRGLAASGRLMAARWRSWRGRVSAEYVEALAALPFLRGAPRSELLPIALHMREQRAPAGRFLVRQGEPGGCLYLIRDGTVEVSKLTAGGRAESLARLDRGDYFGETALIARVPRTANVQAETDVRLITLDAGHFRRYLALRPEVRSALRTSMADRRRLAEIPLFRGLGPADLDRLVSLLLIARFSPGDRIVRQGEPADRFYVIVDGRVEVVRDRESGPEPLAELGAGEYFGEMALLTNTPRSATVRALTPVETYTLTAAGFQTLLGRLPIAAELHRSARLRQGSGHRASLDKCSTITGI